MSDWFYLGGESGGGGTGSDVTIAMAGVERAPVAYGPRVSQPGTVVPPVVATLYRRSDPLTAIATLDEAWGVSWQDQLNETGGASLTLHNTDTDLAAVLDGDLIRFELHGYAAMTILVNDRDQTTIASGEGVDQATTITGPGHLAVLEEARVYPARGVGALPAEEDRVFSWVSVDYDDSEWVAATQLVAQGNNDPVDNPQWFGEDPDPPAPVGWPDAGAWWIWASQGTADNAPKGFCYFRKVIALADPVRLVIYATVDNGGDLYFDGQLLIEGMNDFNNVWTAELDVSAGPHTFAVSGGNTPDPTNVHNPGAILVSWGVMDVNGEVTMIGHTDGSWIMVEYPPTAPGMTVGEILRHVIEEGQARGELEGVTLNFGDTVDSDGEPWQETTEIATKTGTDVLTFAREITGTYADIWMAPGGLELWAWNKGGRGATKAVTLHAPTDPLDPATGNLTGLTHHRTASLINALLVRWHGGWTEVRNEPSIAAHGRYGGLLGLGALQSQAEVERVAREQLAIYADPRTAIAADLEPADETDTPYLAFLVGDTITVPSMTGAPAQERVVALTISQDDNGQVTYAPELRDILLDEHDRFDQNLKKMADGTMRGDSKVATPVSQISSGGSASDCCPPTATGVVT